MHDPIPFDGTDELRAFLDRELRPGERVLWAASVEGGRDFTGYLVALSVAVVAWIAGIAGTAWSSRAEAGRSVRPVDGAILVVGILALIVAFAVTLGLVGGLVFQLLTRPRRAQRFYALTDQRAILSEPCDGARGRSVSSLERGTVEHVSREECAEGRWNLVFSVKFARYFGPTRFSGIAPEPRVEQLARAVLIDPSVSCPD